MNHEAINNVRRKINEALKKDEQRIVVGWRPEFVNRKEGDIWEDHDGRKWTIKNGIKQTVTKLDSAKNPWFCPECEKAMSHKLDSKFWRIRGKCWDCVIKEETKMRAEGRWEEYEKKVIKQNYIAALKDRIEELQEYHDTITAPEFIDADDKQILNVEKWNVNLDTVKNDIMEEIKLMQQNLEAAQQDK